MATDTAPEIEPSRLSKATGAARLIWQLAPTAIGTVVQHYTHGPPQESWPLSTFLFGAVARKHAEIRVKPDAKVDPVKAMQKVRKAIDFGKWVPEPKEGFAVDVEVPVRRSGLGGVLEGPDLAEDGLRTIPAEWVIHNDVRDAGELMSPKVVLYLHGGAYILMNKESHRPLAIQVSKALNSRVFSVSYRLAPESPFPGGLHDAVASYLYLTQELRIPATNIVVSGDSAGGGLSMALLLYLKDSEQLPQIGGGALMSPWVDSTSSLKSWESNSHLDYLTAGDPASPMDPMRLYVGPGYPEALLHPYVCSVAADLSTLPPLLIQVGSAELLRDEGTLLAQRAATAGVNVTHELLDGGVHVAQAPAFNSPVGRAAILGIAVWAKRMRDLNAGTAWDTSSVDALIEKEWIARQARKKGGKTSTVAKEPEGPYRFDSVLRDPPEVLLRESANLMVRKVVEENAEVQRARTGATPTATIYLGVRQKEGLLARVRSTVHI